MIDYNVNIWKVLKNKNYYNEPEEYFNVLSDLGFTSISVWSFLDKKFLEIGKNYGFKIYSLLPEVFKPSKVYKHLSDSVGRSFNQICFSENDEWVENNIKNLSDIVDEYIVTDTPWYWMVKCEKSFLSCRFPPYQTDFFKKMNIPKTFNFEKDKLLWIEEYQPKLIELYIDKFKKIGKYLKEETNQNFWIPITVRSEVSDNLCNKHCVDYYNNFVNEFECNVMFLNATKQGWARKKIGNANTKYLGGTEEALGFVYEKNARKLLKFGYNGTITNEHHLFNNRHPKWEEIKKEMKYLRENI